MRRGKFQSWARRACVALSAAAIAWAGPYDEGVDRLHQGAAEDAERLFRQAVAEGDEPEAAQAYLGLTLAKLKKLDEAEAALAEAEKAGAGESRLKVGRAAIAIERRDLALASTLLDEAVAADDGNAEAYYHRGMVRTAQKEYQRATADFEKVFELDPANAYAHYYAGMAYNGAKRPDKMAEHFQLFLQAAPDAPDADKVKSFLRALR